MSRQRVKFSERMAALRAAVAVGRGTAVETLLGFERVYFMEVMGASLPFSKPVDWGRGMGLVA